MPNVPDCQRSHFALPAVCTALVVSLSGCPSWLSDALSHRDPTAPPPAAGGDGATLPLLPAAPAQCPTLKTGMVQIRGVNVALWVGEEKPNHPAPLLTYWHGTGSSPEEVSKLGPAFDEILAEGGIVAAATETTGVGTDTLFGTWTDGDYTIVDELVACAARQRQLDTRRIYSAGCSEGAVQAGALAYARSSYIASVMMNSGGKVKPLALEDPAHVPAAIAAHGAPDADIVITNFAQASADYTEDLVSKGGFAVICGHGGGHCGAPPELVKAQWEFLKAHPFGVEPEPYAGGLPAGFPAYCKIVE